MSLHEAIYEKHFGPIEHQNDASETSDSEDPQDEYETIEHDKSTWSLIKGAISYGLAWVLWILEDSLSTIYYGLLVVTAATSYLAMVVWCSEVLPDAVWISIVIGLTALPFVLAINWKSSK